MKNHNGYGTILIEIVIAIVVFAFAAAVCVRIFSESQQISLSTNRLSYAILQCENAAECFKSNDGNVEKTVELINGHITPDGFSASFDAKGHPTADKPSFTVIGVIAEDEYLKKCSITALDSDGTDIFSITVAVQAEVVE